MKHPLKISRKVGVLLVGALLFAGSGGALPYLRPIPQREETELNSLRTQLVELSPFSDSALAKLRKTAAEHPVPTWTRERRETYLAALRSDWEIDSQDNGSQCRATLVRKLPRLEDWPEYLRQVRAWQARTDLVLTDLEIAADGAAPARRFTRVAVGLRFAMNGDAGAPLLSQANPQLHSP